MGFVSFDTLKIIFLNGTRINIKGDGLYSSITGNAAKQTCVCAYIPNGLWIGTVEEFSNQLFLVVKRLCRIISLVIVVGPLGILCSPLQLLNRRFQILDERKKRQPSHLQSTYIYSFTSKLSLTPIMKMNVRKQREPETSTKWKK